MQTDSPEPSNAVLEKEADKLSRRSLWWFRGMALLLIPILLGVAELICRVGNWGRVDSHPLSPPGLRDGSSLFVLDQDAQNYVIRESRQKFFVPESFPAQKSQQAFRIFCLGGSTVQGRPYAKETAFSSWLQLSLQAADPTRDWEVINGGGVSYGSRRLVPVLEECLGYQPDLLVLCLGHNEFLEKRSYPSFNPRYRLLAWAIQVASHSRLFHLIRNGAHTLRWNRQPSSNPDSAPQVSENVDALLDYRDGLQAYHRDPEWHARIISEFEVNVRQMLTVSRRAKVPMILLSPPANLRDCPPFKSQHRENLRSAELVKWSECLEQARRHYQTDLRSAIKWLLQAVELDNQYAQTYYSLGKCYEALAQAEPAKAAFQKARELDVCPLRIRAPLERILADLARETQTSFIDLHRRLEERSDWNILGNDWLVDHVHPSIRGHQEIAAAILEEMVRREWVHPVANWTSAQKQSYQRQFDALPELYYLHAQQRLENLRAWTEGRADGPSIELRTNRHSTNWPGRNWR